MLNELSRLYASIRFQETITYDPDSLLKMAKKYAEDNQELLEYIESIARQDSFRLDPANYIETWNEQRGCLDKYLTLEDQALAFFNQFYKF